MFAVVAAPAAPADVPDSSRYDWTQTWIPGSDGTRLHVDVMRPKGIPAEQRTPVVLTVSPYRSHLLHISVPVSRYGPSTADLQAQALLDRGYTFVVVDLRGYGGSPGCPDWGGPGERSDVKTAVEWAAAQPWSTGRVGLYGMSYEGWTGLMGLAERPQGLAAVATIEPVADPYAYIYMDRVPWRFSAKPVIETGVFPSSPTVAVQHAMIAATPGRPEDSPEYHRATQDTPPGCFTDLTARMSDSDPNAPFWRDRDLISRVRGSTIPVFLQQGFIDYNTRADKVVELWNSLGRTDNKAWFGQIGHRDCSSDCRASFLTELFAFFDKHVAGKDVSVPGPRITVGQFDGGWRSEAAFPPVDARRVPIPLRAGSYADRGLLPLPDTQLWSVTAPLPAGQHLSGTPSLTAQVSAPPGATLAVEVYDIDPAGQATVLTRGAARIAGDTVNVRLLAQDWPIPAGHRIGVKLSDTVLDVWAPTPTNGTVTVHRATVELPLLAQTRRPDLDGGPPSGIDKWRREKTITLSQETIAGAQVTANIPDRTG